MIKIGTIGTSDITSKFVQATKLIPEIKISIVSSRTISKAKQFIQNNDLKDSIANDEWKKVIDYVDAVYIGTPNGTHFELAKYFLEHQIHVLVEKTATFTVEEFDQLVKIATQNNLILMEAFRPIHYPQYQLLKNFVNTHEVVNANLLQSSYSRVMDDVLQGKVPPGFDYNLGRGTTYDMLVYPMQLAIDLLGDIVHVKSLRRTLKNKSSVIDVVILQHKTGILTTINNSKMSYATIGNELATVDKVNLVFDTVGNIKNITIHNFISKTKIDSKYLFKKDDEINDMIYEIQDFINLIKNKDFIKRDEWLELTRKTIFVLQAIDNNQDF